MRFICSFDDVSVGCGLEKHFKKHHNIYIAISIGGMGFCFVVSPISQFLLDVLMILDFQLFKLPFKFFFYSHLIGYALKINLPENLKSICLKIAGSPGRFLREVLKSICLKIITF